MAYHAHSIAGHPEAEWEPLARHLAEVAAGARCRGQRFGAEALAALAGLTHDLGKYHPAFQARLRGQSGRVDHSTAGAAWACARLGQKWGRLIAHVVAGHHAGLQDGLFAAEGRIAAAGERMAVVVQAAEADGLALPPRVAGPPSLRQPGEDFGFRMAFLTRMVFSCLLDADRSAAAGFEARASGAPVEAVAPPAIAALETALQAWMAARLVKQTPLNALRAEVLRAALARAGEPPGVFALTVPTGGGKTLTSLAFALAHAREHGLDRVIVVIPFTSIIEQTAAVYRTALGALGDAVLEHHSAFELEKEGAWAGERVGPARLLLAMERWDSRIVVTTAVQFFESLFSNRPSRCRKLHSLARSVVVVDEAQTMPLPLLRPCVAALKELAGQYGSSVVLCTATQPALAAPGFPGGFAAPRELAPRVPELFTALRRVTVRAIGVQEDAALAVRIAASPQALCIVNQRAHARALFRAISHLPGARHLSTAMHSVHRARVLAEIRAALKEARPCRVISTSLVEAGVDLDFPLVLRAAAGLDQIAQAAGRCNREFRHSPAASEVLVFEAPAYPVLQSLRANAESGEAVLRQDWQDPFAPAAMQAYFAMLYGRKGQAELDRPGVLEMCADHAGDLDFPFATIAAAMRFIADAMVPVIVAREEARPGEVAALVEELRFAQDVGRIARELGRYTVGVPRRARNEMLAKGVAEVIRLDEFGDQFVVLHNLDLYTPELGLDWEDVTFRTAEGLMAA
jgi:CRISPR-associated endonuclease/helicase Cas3